MQLQLESGHRNFLCECVCVCVGLKRRMGLKIPERCQPKQPSWLDNRSSLWGLRVNSLPTLNPEISISDIGDRYLMQWLLSLTVDCQKGNDARSCEGINSVEALTFSTCSNLFKGMSIPSVPIRVLLLFSDSLTDYWLYSIWKVRRVHLNTTCGTAVSGMWICTPVMH